jgi:hypothetical protein
MPIVVHPQGCDSIARLQAKPLERLGHPPRIVSEPLPIRSNGGAVRPRCDDLPLAVLALGMIHEPHDPERPVLHRAQ